MTEYLKSAVERYDEQFQLLHPISQVDAEIFQELIVLLEKMNYVVYLDVLKEYKLEKDEVVLEKLKGINKAYIQLAQPTPKVEEEKLIRYLKVNGKRIDLFLVISFEENEFQLKEGDEITYCIIINPIPENTKNVPMYANTILTFKTQDARDKCSKSLDDYFVKARGEFYGDFE